MLKRTIAFLLGYKYYLANDHQTVRRVKDNYGFVTPNEFAKELRYRGSMKGFWDTVYSKKIVFDL